ncbi:MAG: heme-binding protein [Alphaproteobacteria bacterium]
MHKRKKVVKMVIGIVLGAAVLGAVLWGPVVSNSVEQAKYTVLEQVGNMELREYAPHLAAEVEVAGERKEAISQGFRLIADYIFGNNIAAESIAMTTPVTQQPVSAPIAMTSPVLQQEAGNGLWHVRFIMPSQYSMQSIPQPKNTAVKLVEVPAKRVAALRFSGRPSEADLAEKNTLLQGFITQKGLVSAAPATYAFYNPPWTLPFLRRNEVLMEVQP